MESSSKKVEIGIIMYALELQMRRCIELNYGK